MKRSIALALLCVACGGEEVVEAPMPVSGLVVAESELRFGNVVTGESTVQTVTVTNEGPEIVPLAWWVEPADTPVFVTGRGALESGATQTIELAFAPDRSMGLRADFVITDGVTEREVQLRGTGRPCPVVFDKDVVQMESIIGEIARAPLLEKNYSGRSAFVGPGDSGFGDVCGGAPWHHRMCIHLPGRRQHFVNNVYEVEPFSITEGSVIHLPSRPGLEAKDITLRAGPRCSLAIRVESRARWGDLECNADELQEIVLDGTCRPATARCSNRTQRTIAITGWSAAGQSVDVEPSRRIDVPPGGTFSIDLEVCSRDRLEIEGDFEEPLGVMHLGIGS